VVKCLLEQKLLPQVISGTSGGALIAALISVRTDNELLDILNSPEELMKRINAMDEPYLVLAKRMLKKGILFDHNRWVEKMQWVTKGTITFLEAYQQTGKILNITVIPTEKHAPPMLLNFRTTPNVVIYSAVLASASIPLLVEPAELLYKAENGTLEPYHLIGKSWRDGSFKTDIPAKPLHRLFNVNYTIVSQVNPHIAFFFFENRGSGGAPSLHRKGTGW
jgi:predicted acylesterase/phospholipase RssA